MQQFSAKYWNLFNWISQQTNLYSTVRISIIWELPTRTWLWCHERFFLVYIFFVCASRSEGWGSLHSWSGAIPTLPSFSSHKRVYRIPKDHETLLKPPALPLFSFSSHGLPLSSFLGASNSLLPLLLRNVHKNDGIKILETPLEYECVINIKWKFGPCSHDWSWEKWARKASLETILLESYGLEAAPRSLIKIYCS